MLTRIIVIMLSMVAAVTCYAMGLHAGLVVFALFGVLFELVFWIALAKRRPDVVKQSHPG
ncbi:hypothetical protein [Alteromonas sp. CYL-A6]|uniref:hypothetical protein n=1 Tax=Alteromonas nitratireducens TaxID=3390813 RepID=UPI0034B172F7